MRGLRDITISLFALAAACATEPAPQPGTTAPEGGPPLADAAPLPSDAGSLPADAQASQAPPAPDGLSATAGDAIVSLTWTPSAGATAYRVFRGAGSDPLALLAPTTTTSYVDRAVTNGVVYTYRVAAVGAGGEGPRSRAVEARPQVAPPGAPQGLVAEAGDATVALRWDALAAATTFRVYRSGAAGQRGAALGTTTSPSYTDGSVTNGVTYWYTVVGVNAGGEGPGSTQVSATPVEAVRPKLGLTMFVTIETHDGGFGPDAALPGANPIAKADAFCMASASRRDRATYKALLVDGALRDAVTPTDWVLRPSTAYYQVDGTTLIGTTTPSAVFDVVPPATLDAPVDSSAFFDNKYVWTGIGTNGWGTVNTCAGWTVAATTSSGQMGVIGRVNSQAFGVGVGSLCQNPQRLLCVEQ